MVCGEVPSKIVLGGGLAGVERRRGGHHLEGRARRVALLRGAVEQRLVRVAVERARTLAGSALGSYVGTDAITRTLPVCGSSATIAPLRPASAAYGAPAAPSGSRLVTTSSPSRSLARAARRRSTRTRSPCRPASSLRGLLEAAPAVADERVADRVREQRALGIGARVGARSRRGRCGTLRGQHACGRRARGSARAGPAAPRSAARRLLGLSSRVSASKTVQQRGEADQQREQDA